MFLFPGKFNPTGGGCVDTESDGGGVIPVFQSGGGSSLRARTHSVPMLKGRYW